MGNQEENNDMPLSSYRVLDLPEGVVTRGRIFLALPGYGEVSVNGRRVDDPDTGSRMLSQYDVRMLYVRSRPPWHLFASRRSILASTG